MDQRQIFQQQPAVETCLRGTSPIDPPQYPVETRISARLYFKTTRCPVETRLWRVSETRDRSSPVPTECSFVKILAGQARPKHELGI